MNEEVVTQIQKIMRTVEIQYNAPIPEMPLNWTGEEQWGYIKGWEDAMERVWNSVLVYDYEPNEER